MPDYHFDPAEEQSMLDDSLSDTQKIQLLAVLQKFDSVATSNIRHTSLTTHNIVNEAIPLRIDVYRCPAAWKEQFQELDYLWNKGFILSSDSPWTALMFAVPKKNG